MSADRELLFGILALQNSFVTREQLLAAFDVWVADKARGLGDLLVARGALQPAARQALDLLADQHVARHGNDPRQSLAAVGSAGPLREDLEALADPDVQASLRHVARHADPAETRSYVGQATSAGARFRVLRPHARGGLGEVLVAEDTELHREVALKQIQGRHGDDPAARTRFLVEAEITGGLEHPGIVPVYGLGHYADGRPFYAMRFIKGDNLKEAIDRFHSTKPQGGPSSPGGAFQGLEFRQLLGRFIDVCQAVAYAHSRGVLHRDLKPGNIMLGKYGETLVVDWGLAKAGTNDPAARGGDSELTEPALIPPSASGSGETVAGTAVGTPQYMSPEQASGRLDLLGPASDVYGLGATLYTLLTGRAPFPQKTTEEVLKHVQQGDFPGPRQVRSEVPAALEAVCLRAMRLNPAHRYGGAVELAAELERWLADEPVHAHGEPWPARAGRWARKHKPLVSGAAAALLVAATALTAATFWYQDYRAEAARRQVLTEQSARAALEQAAHARDELHRTLRRPGGVFELLDQPARWQAQLRAARGALDQAEALLANAEDTTGSGLQPQVEELGALLDRDEADRQLALRLEAIRLDKATLVEGKYGHATATREYPRAFAEVGLPVEGGDVAALAARIAGSPIREQLTATLDDWALSRFIQGEDVPESLLRLARQADPSPPWGDVVRQPETWRVGVRLTELLEQAPSVRLSPHMYYVVGGLLRIRKLDAVSWLRKAQAEYPADFWLNLELAHALSPANRAEALGFYRAALALRPGTAVVHYDLGVALFDQGRVDEALTAYRKAIALDPRYAPAHNNLGLALADQGRHDEAVAAYRKATEVNPKHAKAYNNLGLALGDLNRPDDAIAAFQKALEIAPDYAKAYNNLGAALNEQKRNEEALAAYRKATALDPGYGKAYFNLANALHDLRRLDEAVAAYQKAVELLPQDASAHVGLGVALKDSNRLPESMAAYEKAIALDPKDAMAHYNFGILLADQGRSADAIAAYRKAIDLKADYAKAYSALANALGQQKRLKEAMEAHQKAIALDPKFAGGHFNLGVALERQGRFDEALAAYRKASEIDPTDAKPHAGLGNVYLARDKLDEALAAFRKAIELDPTYPDPYSNLGIVLRRRNQIDAAIAAYRKAIALKPNNASDYYNLGIAYRLQKRWPEATDAHRKAVELRPSDADYHQALGRSLKDQDRLDEALAAFRRARELDPKSADVLNDLGIALRRSNRPEEAVAAYRQAVALDPNYMLAHNNLGSVLMDLDRAEEAAAAYRKALTLNPKYAPAHGGLANALLRLGAFAEAAAAAEKALALLPAKDSGRATYERRQKQAQQLLALEQRLPGAVAGKDADAKELLVLANLCREYKARYVTAARLYERAFQADPRLTADLGRGDRYRAACAAALAGWGQCAEAGRLSEEEKARLRQQARSWLQADLDFYGKLLKEGSAAATVRVAGRLADWEKEPALAAARAAGAGSADQDRAAWQALWAGVRQLLGEARSRFTETRLEGVLTAAATTRAHPVELTAGKTYVFDLASPAFDALLRLQDAEAKLLAENDDVGDRDLNARLVFTPTQSGGYHLVATSYQERGTGRYTLTVREFKGTRLNPFDGR